MKVSLKGNKWVFKFDKATISCSITKEKNTYLIFFELNNKIVKIKTNDLDKTFLSLEEAFNSRTIFNYR